MKRTITLFLALVMALSLAACGGEKDKKPKSLADIESIFFDPDPSIRIQIDLNDENNLHVELISYKKDSASPSGWSMDSSKEYDLYYSLDLDHYINVGGETYYYTIDAENQEVVFSVEFMNLTGATKWDYYRESVK